jgi:hypothetical protein
MHLSIHSFFSEDIMRRIPHTKTHCCIYSCTLIAHKQSKYILFFSFMKRNEHTVTIVVVVVVVVVVVTIVMSQNQKDLITN